MRHLFLTAATLALAACSSGGDTAAPANTTADKGTDANTAAPALSETATPEPAGTWDRYTNRRFDFAIETPPGFVAGAAPQNDDGRIFRDGTASLRVFGGHNALGQSFASQIAQASRGLSDIDVTNQTATTWRATARDGVGNRVALLLARPAPSRLVTAHFTYPPGGGLAQNADQALDSLLLLGQAGPLIFRYRPERLTAVPADLSLPPDYSERIDGTKLLPVARAARLGQDGCRYGLSGTSAPCDADKEAGLAFAVSERALDDLRATFEPERIATATLAGRNGFRIEQGAEGEGAAYTFLPAGDRTVVIERRWRDAESRTGYQSVLRDLSFSDD